MQENFTFISHEYKIHVGQNTTHNFKAVDKMLCTGETVDGGNICVNCEQDAVHQ